MILILLASRLWRLIYAAMLICLSSPSFADDKITPQSDKLRILVDKVLMRSTNWIMKENHVKEIADAGFNVVSPRSGGEDLNQVRLIASYAQKNNIRYLPWMRGTRVAKTGPKMLYDNGMEHNICSPSSDELWQWMTALILGYAAISKELPALMGVFLDFENYHPPQKPGHVYFLSYDTAILTEFANAKGFPVPNVEKPARYQWLINHGLHREFSEFQIRDWRNRCRDLRQRVDSINPRFQFVVNPGKGTPFLTEAAFLEWPTANAPIVLADDITYGRPSPTTPHEDALNINKKRLNDRIKQAERLGVPFKYIGGIDPVVRFADPEFSARNAVMISETADGYWVFYEGPQIGKDHEAYFGWFSKANLAIKTGTFQFWSQNRITLDPVVKGLQTN